MRLDTRAFAIASGAVAAAMVFLLTILWVVSGRDPAPLGVLAGVLFGYSVSVAGAFVGSMWAYAYGFFAGAALAFVYNLGAVSPAPGPGHPSSRDPVNPRGEI